MRKHANHVLPILGMLVRVGWQRWDFYNVVEPSSPSKQLPSSQSPIIGNLIHLLYYVCQSLKCLIFLFIYLCVISALQAILYIVLHHPGYGKKILHNHYFPNHLSFLVCFPDYVDYSHTIPRTRYEIVENRDRKS